MSRYVDLDERVTAQFYDQECEEWTMQTATIEDVLDSVCDEYTVLPSADPEAAIVKVLKMVEEYKEKTGTDEIIIMPKNGMKAWDENGVEYTMQPTCNNLATDTISRQSAINAIKKSRFLVDAMEKVIKLPSARLEIIRCTDCKWYEGDIMANPWGVCCQPSWVDGNSGHEVAERGWCYRAERREE